MKYLKKYKMFESDSDDDQDEDDIVKKGFKHSWNDIKECMIYLNDVGFELDSNSVKQYLIDDNGDKVYLADADSSVIELTMTKPVNPDDVFYRSQDDGGYPRRTTYYYFSKWNDKILDMQEAIASFCQRFEDCYQHLSLSQNYWILKFIIYEKVDVDLRNKQKEEDLISKIESNISDRISRIRSGLFDTFNRTTRDKAKTNKLGENMWHGVLGSLEKGHLMIPVNTLSSGAKTVKSTIMPVVEDRCRIFNNMLEGCGKAEVKIITEDDINDFVKTLGDVSKKNYYMERYLGLTGIIMKFNYKKLFNKTKKNL